MKYGGSSRGIRTDLEHAFSACRGIFILVLVFSLFSNLVLFVSPLYLLQVYDRVLTTHSYETLLMLTAIAAVALVVMDVLEFARSRLLIRAGVRLETQLGGRVFAAIFRSTVDRQRSIGTQPLRDVTSLREFLSGGGIIVFCDAPWVPIFILALFMLHPLLGLVSVGGAIVLFCLAVLNEVATRRPLHEASGIAASASAFTEAGLRNAEAVAAMAMMPGVLRRWLGRQGQAMRLQSLAADRAGTILAHTKSIRLGLQIAIIGIGGWLAIKGQITPGTIVASSIIMSRALAPVEMAVSHWKGFIRARTAYARLKGLLLAVPDQLARLSLEKPTGLLAVEQVVAGPPGNQVPVLRGISLRLAPGDVLGVIGPSGAGKSTLARVLVGVWPILAGSIRLDGAELDHWNPEQLGLHLGYLPQDVELFDATVTENIARLAETVDSVAVISAARKAGVHDLILHLPNAYETRIGPGGQKLSAGQRQRIGLARALYGDPRLIVLDEPNSNLDFEGEAALGATLSRLREEKTTVVVITHRPNLLSCVDKILMLRNGQVEAFGPREEIMVRHIRPSAIDSSRPNRTEELAHEGSREIALGKRGQAAQLPQEARQTDG